MFPATNLPHELSPSKCIVGIDEAGRGPVLGPLVYAIFFATRDSAHLLKNLGAADSKSLTRGKRESFFHSVLSAENRQKYGWNSYIIHPKEISDSMLRKTRNLNELSLDAVFELIESLYAVGIDIEAGFVDTLGKADRYEHKLQKLFPKAAWTVRPKADGLYPIVGAASTIAKVLRDALLVDMAAKAGISEQEVGSGYPSDPVTISWMNGSCDKIFGYPDFVRFSWSSCSRILALDAVKLEW